MIPGQDAPRIVYLTQAEFRCMPTGSFEVGVIYRVFMEPRPPEPLPIRAPKPWEKWTQHPKSPRASHFKKARRQPGT